MKITLSTTETEDKVCQRATVWDYRNIGLTPKPDTMEQALSSIIKDMIGKTSIFKMKVITKRDKDEKKEIYYNILKIEIE